MARTSVAKAKWAITGVAPNALNGSIVAWHDEDEIGAYRDAKNLRKLGYTDVSVISATLDGELDEDSDCESDEMADPDYGL